MTHAASRRFRTASIASRTVVPRFTHQAIQRHSVAFIAPLHTMCDSQRHGVSWNK